MAIPRDATNRLLGRFGVEVRRKPACLVRSPNEISLTLEYACAHLAAFNPGCQFNVVQVGAFDGRSNDPLQRALREFGWRGVLVEPQPEPFSSLKTMHEGNEFVQIFNVAIADTDGTRMMYAVEGDGLPAWTPQATSFDRELIEVQLKALPGSAQIRQIEVETWTFDTLLRRAGIERVDVLQLDAEGYDFELLKHFEANRRLPVIIGYEHQHLTKSDRDAAAELLVRCGYRLAMTFGVGDTLAIRPR